MSEKKSIKIWIIGRGGRGRDGLSCDNLKFVVDETFKKEPRKVRKFVKEYSDGEQIHEWVGKESGNKGKVVEIQYHEPLGLGDSHYLTTIYSTGYKTRSFNPDHIVFYGPNEVE